MSDDTAGIRCFRTCLENRMHSQNSNFRRRGTSSRIIFSRKDLCGRGKPFTIVIMVTLLVCLSLCYLFGHRLIHKWTSLTHNSNMLEYLFIEVPQYVIIDMNKMGVHVCSQLFAQIVPNIEQFNATDRELIQSLSKFDLNPAYLRIHHRKEKLWYLSRGQLCSNNSHEKILFSSSENNHQMTVDRAQTQSIFNKLTDGFECSDLDLKTCQYQGLDTTYPKLFEFSTQKLIVRDVSAIVDIVYQYVRRQARDYKFIEDKLSTSPFQAVNFTFNIRSISSNGIVLKIFIHYRKEVVQNIPCQASADGTNFHRDKTINNDNLVTFDELMPSTAYNICASCGKIDRSCTQITTLSDPHFSSPSRARNYVKFGPILLLALPILLIGVCLCRSINYGDDGNPTDITITLGSRSSIQSDQTDDSEEETDDPSDSQFSPDSPTLDGRSVQEIPTAASSIESIIARQEN